MGEKTSITKATSKSDSLRTTIPSGIAKQFDMKEKDSLNWNIDVKGSKLVIIVNHIRQDRLFKEEKPRNKNRLF